MFFYVMVYALMSMGAFGMVILLILVPGALMAVRLRAIG